MKHTNSGPAILFILPALWLGQSASVAQQNDYALTNNAQSQTNLQSEMNSLAARTGAPYLGTSALPGTLASRVPDNPTGPPLASWGPFQVYPRLLYLFSYGNGIQAVPGSNPYTFVNEVAPSLLIKAGSLLTLDYTPSIYFYSNPLFHDKTDQNVLLSANKTNGDWALGLSQTYIDTTQPLVETGTQTEQTAFATELYANRQLGTKSSLELGLDQTFRFVQGADLTDLHEWKTVDWFNYQFQPQLGAALGVTGGYDELSSSSDMPFEQLLGRLIFRPGTKLSITIIGGAEERQFVNPYQPSYLNPIFQGIALYQIRHGTLLTVTGSRAVVPSLFQDEVNVITTVSANIRQHIVGNVNLEIEGSYTSEPFTSISGARRASAAPATQDQFVFGNSTPAATAPLTPVAPLSEVRSDTRETLQIRLSTVFRSRLTASIFCMINDNTSTSGGFSYSGVQSGLELDYRY